MPSDVDSLPLLEDYVPITYGSVITLFSSHHESFICIGSLDALATTKKSGSWEQFVIEKALSENQINSTREERESSFGEPVYYNHSVHLKSRRSKYVSTQSMGTINCTKDSPKNNETFIIEPGEDLDDRSMNMSLVPVMNCSLIALRSVQYSKYIVSTKLGLVFCNRTQKKTWERFKIQMTIRHPLKAHLNRKVVSIRDANDDELNVERKIASFSAAENVNDTVSGNDDEIVVPLRQSQDFNISDAEHSASFIEKFNNKILNIKKMIKNIATSADKNRQLDLIRNEIILAESIEKSLTRFFSQKKNRDDMHIERLKKQFLEIKQIFNSDIVNSKELKNAQMERRKINYRAIDYNDEDEDDDLDRQIGNIRQELKQKSKMKLSEAQQHTLDVEKAVALETYNSVKDMERDYNGKLIVCADYLTYSFQNYIT